MMYFQVSGESAPRHRQALLTAMQERLYGHSVQRLEHLSINMSNRYLQHFVGFSTQIEALQGVTLAKCSSIERGNSFKMVYDCVSQLMKHAKYAHHYFSTSSKIIKSSCTLRQNNKNSNSVWDVTCLIDVMEMQCFQHKMLQWSGFPWGYWLVEAESIMGKGLWQKLLYKRVENSYDVRRGHWQSSGGYPQNSCWKSW